LRPYSTHFKDTLKYKVFRFEPSFSLSAGDVVNPELVLTSSERENTLVLEWTIARELNSHKEDQLERYAAVKREDLTDVLAVPVNEARTHDITVILKEDSAVQEYKRYLGEQGWLFPLLKWDAEDSRYALYIAEHRFQDSETNAFFSGGIHLEKPPPLNYLPFSLEDIEHHTIVDPVVQHLVSLMVKSTAEVTIEEFCSGFVRAWRYIDSAKQQLIRQKTRQVLMELAGEQNGRLILRRIGDNPATWLLDPEGQFQNRMRSLQNYLTRFISRKRGESYQEPLFE